MHEIDTRLVHEKLEREALRAAGAGGTVVELPRAGLGVRDELFYRRGRHRGMHGQGSRHVYDKRDADEIAQRPDREFRKDARVNRLGADIAEKYGVAIGV